MQIRSFPNNDRNPSRERGASPKPKIEVRSIDVRKAGSRRRRRRPAPKGPSLMWIRVVTLAVLLFAGFLIFGLPQLLRQRGQTTPWAPPSNLEIVTTPTPSTLRFPSPNQAQVAEVVKAVLAMRTPEQFDSRIRLKDVSEAEAVRYLSDFGASHGGVKRVAWAGAIPATGIQLEAARVSFLDETVRDRMALLTPDAEGNWQLDLAAFMAKGTVDWETLCESSSEEGQVRVSIQRDTYYNGDFNDEKVWSCFEMNHPDSDRVLVGYAEKGSPAEKALTYILKSRSPAHVILKARKVPSRGNSQAILTSVLADNWVLTDEVYDEDFQEKSPSQ